MPQETHSTLSQNAPAQRRRWVLSRHLAEVVGHTVHPLPPAHEHCQGVRWSPDREKLLDDSDGLQTICSTRTSQPIATIQGALPDLEFDASSRFIYGKKILRARSGSSFREKMENIDSQARAG